MSRLPKHESISQYLLDEISAGKYTNGQRLPTESQLVKRFKVSRPTVTRAMRDLQEQGIIERRAGSGTYLKQRSPDDVASATGDRQLGLLIPGLGTTEIFEVICGEMAGMARMQGLNLIWGGGSHPRHSTSGSIDSMQQFCEYFVERKIRGVFFAPIEHVEKREEVNQHIADQLRLAGISVVLIDRDLGGFGERSEFDLVSIDNVMGGFLLANHLLKLGCRKPLFVSRALSAPSVIARAAGAREAMRKYRIREPDDFHRVGDPSDPVFVESLDAGRSCDSIICANDLTAAQMMQTLDKMRIRIPRHVRLAGFDDVRYASLLSVPLTTIHQPCREFAMIALRMMLDRLADPMLPPRWTMLMPRLIVRESCGAYANLAKP